MLGLRIGIDVGGTFTHGVVLRPPGDVLATAVTPTTHRHQQGVAAGIATVLRELTAGLDPAGGEVELVAHSTTQATNALLEGDVSPVQRLVIMPPGEEAMCRWALKGDSLDLGGGHVVSMRSHFVRHAEIANGSWAGAVLPELTQDPVAVIQPLAGSVENLERAAAEAISGLGRAVVCASDITQVLGLTARARTAVVNASMLPTMLATADFTEKAVAEVLPGVPVQVVRSDGGAMSLDEMRKMPILSLLSGPAAGASAALHRSGLSEVIFIEVGGTSTDITLIKEGRVRHRYATVGGHRLMVPALDLRTVAVGGGSMFRSGGKKFGPRSAHIAGKPYFFQSLAQGLSVSGIEILDENSGGPYPWVLLEDDSRAAITLTDLWLAEQLVDTSGSLETGLGISLTEWQRSQFEVLFTPEVLRHYQAARANTIGLIEDAVLELMQSQGVERSNLTLLGGGGGAPAVIEVLAERLDMSWHIAEHHPVISAIGAALAVTCVSQSKTVAEPSSTDIAELVSVVETKLQAQGAERVSTDFEFDPHRQVLTVTGRGNRPYDQEASALSAEDIAARAKDLADQEVELAWDGGDCLLFVAADDGAKRRASRRAAIALDRSGRSLWQGSLKEYRAASGVDRETVLGEIIDSRTLYTDGGPALPGLALVCAGRFIPLDMLGARELISEVLRWENLPAGAESCFILRA